MRQRHLPAAAGGAALALACALACTLAAAPAAAHESASGGKLHGNAAAPLGKPVLVWHTAGSKANGSGVVLRYAVPPKIAAHQATSVLLQFAGVTAPEGATVQIKDSSSGATLMTLTLAQGQQRTVEVPYAGHADGMHFIDVFTAQGGRTSAQQVPVPVGSGERKLKPEGTRGTTASGEAIISLPASSPAK